MLPSSCSSVRGICLLMRLYSASTGSCWLQLRTYLLASGFWMSASSCVSANGGCADDDRSDRRQLSSNGISPQMRLNSVCPSDMAEGFPKYQSVVSSTMLVFTGSKHIEVDSISIRLDCFLFFFPACFCCELFLCLHNVNQFLREAANPF